MARKPGSKSEFVLFDVTYEDGATRSNRRVPREILGGVEGDGPARTFLQSQDQEIGRLSGNPMAEIKSVRRS